MDDKPEVNKFGSTEALLKELKERSDDFEKAVLFHPGGYITDRNGVQVMGPFPHYALVFTLASGQSKAIFGADVEAVLNDGILNRMRIPIELASGK